MIDQIQNLPPPHPETLIYSQNLQRLIRSEIDVSGGYIPFVRFMELALYAPGLGYYAAGAQKFGNEGDFVTAPEISPLFSRCLARQCRQVLQKIGRGGVLEFGAGSGVMAADILLELERLHSLPERYWILEVSADLRERQQIFLKTRIPHLFDRISWLDSWPTEPFAGVILANEVLDAMPVHRFRYSSEGIQEFYVGWENNQFIWRLAASKNEALIKLTAKLSIELEHEYYDSEINLLLPEWIKSVSECLNQGLILFIDYGFPKHEYYHADRTMGTLMCHYRHRCHCDPLILVGLQDITAHVNFTDVADVGVATGLQVVGFTNQAAFLLNCGLLDLVSGGDSMHVQLKLSQQIQKLTSPNEMGELFKVIALAKELDDFSLLGFTSQDQRYRL